MLESGVDAVLVKVATIGLDPRRHLNKPLLQLRPLLQASSPKPLDLGHESRSCLLLVHILLAPTRVACDLPLANNFAERIVSSLF
jgi:hypothetical protein